MKNLAEIRRDIDSVDEELIQLFVKRLGLSAEVAAAKRATGKAVFDPARERAILAKVAEKVGPELENEARLLFTTLFSISRGRQHSLLANDGKLAAEIAEAMRTTPDVFPARASVACSGAEGSYAQQATSQLFRVPEIHYYTGFDDVLEAVERGECEYGILPVENSTAGSVAAVYDLMTKRSFKIIRAQRVRIRHVLLAAPGARLEDIREISSHPHALAQCTKFLRAHSGIRAVPFSNTAAAAVALAQSGRRDLAVIASRACAELYGLRVLDENVSDEEHNYTRFILISKKFQIFPGADKISVLMALPHTPGALSDILVKFAAVGVNLTKLESRPVPGSDFEFRFVFDLKASPCDPRVVQLLSGFASDPGIECFSFLGAYTEE